MGVGGSEMGRSHAFPPVCGRAEVHRRRRNAPGQRKHPAQRQVSRLSTRISGNISSCGRKGPCTTISDRVGVAKRRCPRPRSGNPSLECTSQRKHTARHLLFSPVKSSQWEYLAVRSQGVMHYDLRPCGRRETTMSALQKRNTIIIGAAKPTLGSESRVSSGETAQACTARYQGGPWHHSYA